MADTEPKWVYTCVPRCVNTRYRFVGEEKIARPRADGVGSLWWRARDHVFAIGRSIFPTRDRHRRNHNHRRRRRRCFLSLPLLVRFQIIIEILAVRREKGWRSRGEKEGAMWGSRREEEEDRARCPSLSLSPQYLAATIFSGRFALRLTIAGNYLPSTLRARRVLYLRRFHGGFIVIPAPILSPYISLSLSTPRPPLPPHVRPPSHDRRRAHRRRSAAVATSYSFCLSRSTTSLVCLRRLCRWHMCARARARTW